MATQQTDWTKPQDVDEATAAFPAGIVGTLLPPTDAIPSEYESLHHPTVKIVARWFFKGLPKGTEFVPREGIDKTKALRQVKACMGSWEPKHEHKEAGCAFLLDQFFERIDIPDD